GLGVAAGRRHIWAPGVSGVGKSTMAVRLALADLEAGRGLALFDPNGDAANDLLGRAPRIENIVVIDAADAHPPAINLLDGKDAALMADNVVGVFAAVHRDSWGPRLDDLFR